LITRSDGDLPWVCEGAMGGHPATVFTCAVKIAAHGRDVAATLAALIGAPERSLQERTDVHADRFTCYPTSLPLSHRARTSSRLVSEPRAHRRAASETDNHLVSTI
jgi:hypothetical protein